MMARSAAVLLSLAIATAPVAAADAQGVEAGNGRLIEAAEHVVALVDVDNPTGSPRAVVDVRLGRVQGILEIRGKDGWEAVPSLRVPGHAQLMMDAERGPRVRLPSAMDRTARLQVTFDDGTVAAVATGP